MHIFFLLLWEKNCIFANSLSMKTMMSSTIFLQPYDSPCGPLLLGSYGDRLCLCDWATERPRPLVDHRLQRFLKAPYRQGSTDVIEMARQQLDGYFRQERHPFDVPLLFVGTDFQKAVWQALSTIPYGTTVSYAALAEQIGSPQSVRAVANANGANAISIFVPCHRVIGSDGSLTGYAGGLEAKRFLLALEK